jgi:hypothetical protein
MYTYIYGERKQWSFRGEDVNVKSLEKGRELGMRERESGDLVGGGGLVGFWGVKGRTKMKIWEHLFCVLAWQRGSE